MLSLILSVGLLVNTAIGFTIFSLAPGRSENRAFAIFSWLLALWIVNDLLFWGFPEADADGAVWARVAFLISVGIQVSIIWFTNVFPKPRAPNPSRLAFLAVLVVVALVFILGGYAIGPVGFRGGRFSMAFTPGTFIVGSIIYLLFFLGRWELVRRRQEAKDLEERWQLDTLLIADGISSIAITGLCILPPVVGIYSLLPYASIAILVGSLIHGYAVFNFRLLKPASLLDHLRLFPVTGKLAISVAAAFFVAVFLVLVLSRTVIGPGDWTRAAVYSLSAASVPAMALIFFAQRLITRPLRDITEAALAVSQGDTQVRVVAAEARDEVAILGAAFNTMVERLEHDIEALRRMSDAMLRSERLATAGALAAGVAHEVNNPLAAMSSLIQIVQSRLEDPKQRETLDQALAQMERISKSLGELMDLARPREETRGPCDLKAVIARTLGLLRYDKGFRGIEIVREVPEDLPVIEADGDRIQQVLMNLLLNARDALRGQRDARITIAAADPGERLSITVTDNGPGIPAEVRARIFEPFYTTKAHGSGTGLGLAVCRDIIREHDGLITIDSAPGRGAAITLSLPRAPRKSPQNVG